NDITMLYTTSDYGGGKPKIFGVSPHDRKHDAKKAGEGTYIGYNLGDRGGGTPGPASNSFFGTTRGGRGGFFHFPNMHMVEKFTRKGDEILYELTIEDPDVLVEPWVMPARTLRLNAAPDAGLVPERAYCEVYETDKIVTQMRH